MGVCTTGCHHMAFVTDNIDETVQFHNGGLGFPVVMTLQLPNPGPFPGAVPRNLGGSRHYIFRISEQDTIAFFEFADVEVPADNSLPGAGNHLAITVPSEAELQKAKKHLEGNGVKIKSELDHGFCRSIHFNDPVSQPDRATRTTPIDRRLTVDRTRTGPHSGALPAAEARTHTMSVTTGGRARGFRLPIARQG